MKTDGVFQEMAGTLKKGFDVGKAFGKPVELQGTTIIPVARISVHGGGGGGEGPIPDTEDQTGSGGGFGFMGGVIPMGYIEAKDDNVRWVQVIDWTKVIGNVSAVLVLYMLKARRHRKFKKAWKAYRAAGGPHHPGGPHPMAAHHHGGLHGPAMHKKWGKKAKI